jgi:hypothetical protein
MMMNLTKKKISRARIGFMRRIFYSRWIKRIFITMFIIYCVFYFQPLTHYVLSLAYNLQNRAAISIFSNISAAISIFSNVSAGNQNFQVQALFPNSTLKTNNIYLADFSGEYEEIPAILTRNNTIHSYAIDEIYILLTSNSRRIHHSKHFIKFWAKYPGVKCLIVFEEHDFKNNKNISKYLANEGIPCRVQPSNVTRFEERYLHLVHHAWTNRDKDDGYVDIEKIKWFAVGDDDTVWFINNLLYTLQQYNSLNKIYLGDYSDRTASIHRHGSYYAYGGGGILFSQPLAIQFAKHVHKCKQFLNMYGGDEMIGKCVTQVLNINLTRNSNFHQMDNGGDVTGLLESGLDRLVTLHHMFYLWRPFPDEHSNKLNDTIHLLELAYKTFDEKFLKRYVRFNYKTNQTVLVTMGYTFSVFSRILSDEELIGIEKTWCCTDMVERKTRPKDSNKATWYFGGVTRKMSGGVIGHAAIYENKKNTYGLFPQVEVTLMN